MPVIFRNSVLFLLIITGFSACGQTRKATAAATLLEVTSQRTLPGRSEADPFTDYELFVVWKSARPPLSFFWKDGEAWMPCQVKRFTRAGVPSDRRPELRDISLQQIRRGDSLMLVPLRGGKYPVPSVAAAGKGSTLYFQISKSGWMYLPASHITRKPDIIMP